MLFDSLFDVTKDVRNRKQNERRFNFDFYFFSIIIYSMHSITTILLRVIGYINKFLFVYSIKCPWKKKIYIYNTCKQRLLY